MPTILVVDDDVDTCLNMVDLFGELGYTVDAAEGGELALEKARQQSYELGLLDLRMPGMDGLTLCRHLKRLHPRMVTILITAHGGSDLEEQAYDAGARHVLLKPIDFPRLLALVERALPPTNGRGPVADESSIHKDPRKLPASWDSCVDRPVRQLHACST
jgi:CheY-like chemotaxis protein